MLGGQRQKYEKTNNDCYIWAKRKQIQEDCQQRRGPGCFVSDVSYLHGAFFREESVILI